MSSFGGFTVNKNNAEEANLVDSSTPWIAASDGDLALLLTALKELNLSPWTSDSNGFTPLHSASSYNQIECIQWLLQQEGVDVDAQDSDGDTALHHCDNVEAARVLVEQGNANIAIQNSDGKTALELKEEDITERKQDEDDYDSDDEDIVGLKELIHYLKGLTMVDDQDS